MTWETSRDEVMNTNSTACRFGTLPEPPGEPTRTPGNRSEGVRPNRARYGPFDLITLSRWRASGKGPRFIKYANSRSDLIRYRFSDFNDFVNQCVFSPTTVLPEDD